MSELKRIFDGDYYPSETVVPTSPEYKQKRKECIAAQERLEQALGTENDHLFSEFLDAQAEVSDLMNYEFFLEGIRLGASLEQEIHKK